MSCITLALLLLISSISNPVVAQDFAECKEFFINGIVPIVSNHPNTRALCFDEFAVLHSGQSKTPVYVAERLNKEKIDAKVKRVKKFFADEIADAKEKDVLFSLHMKATMMKVSDPVIFGYCVNEFYADVLNKHADIIKELGFNSSNGIGDLYNKLKGH